MTNHGKTSLKVTQDTRDHFRSMKKGSETYDDLLNRMMDRIEQAQERGIIPKDAF